MFEAGAARYSATALRIHADLPVVDGHNDFPWALQSRAGGDLTSFDPRRHLEGYHTDVPRLRAGGVGAQFWSVYVPVWREDPFRDTMAQIELVGAMTARAPDVLEMAQTADEARSVRRSGKTACLLGAEGGHCIANSLDNLAALAAAGVRYLTLTHSDSTDWADSATDEARHGGLTSFGREVVRAMNDLGILVDLSHVSVPTMRDAIDASSVPVIASHSNAAAIAPHPRNIPDDVLAAIGERGGVVMVAFFPGFIVEATARTMTELFDRWRAISEELAGDEAAIAAEIERIEGGLDLDRGDVAQLVDHIEHIAEIAGVDAVGLGSDYDGMTMTPAGLEDVSCYPAITDELLRRGWNEPEIRKVLGENALRVLAAAG